MFAVAGAAALAVCAAPPEGRPKNAILIGWDGAQREHVKESLARAELPNLQRLADCGALVAIDILRATDTKAGWAQILTGYEPERTGVFSNGRFQPIPRGYTVFERLEAHFRADNFATVAVIGKKNNVGAAGPKRVPLGKGGKGRKPRRPGKIVVEDGQKYLQVPGEPFHTATESMDVFINGLGSDEAVGAKALELLETYRDMPFFFFVHFSQVDHKGHRHGENSPEYNEALMSADRWTGRIMAKLEELGLANETLVYVTADHGFDEGAKTHRDAPYVFLATNDRGVVRRGTRADIAPTILERFGLDLDAIEPPLDGQPLTEPYTAPRW
ncbi:MAG: alkaline phosphatase family protein [Planctomycetota bacterium]